MICVVTPQTSLGPLAGAHSSPYGQRGGGDFGGGGSGGGGGGGGAGST